MQNKNMPMITFQGMIVSIGTGVNPELAVCCASRIDSKDWRVISLEGKFADKFPDLRLEAGMLVSGQARLMEIWDGSIVAQFMAEDFQILPNDMLTDLMENPLKSIRAPQAKRKISLAGKEFCHS